MVCHEIILHLKICSVLAVGSINMYVSSLDLIQIYYCDLNHMQLSSELSGGIYRAFLHYPLRWYLPKIYYLFVKGKTFKRIKEFTSTDDIMVHIIYTFSKHFTCFLVLIVIIFPTFKEITALNKHIFDCFMCFHVDSQLLTLHTRPEWPAGFKGGSALEDYARRW